MKIKYIRGDWTITKEIDIPLFCKISIIDMILLNKQIRAYETELNELKQKVQYADIWSDISYRIFRLKIDIADLKAMQSAIHRKVIEITKDEDFWRKHPIDIEEYFYDRRLEGK